MNVFGIALTLGHLIVAIVAIAIYDIVWDAVFPDDWSTRWFRRHNLPLRIMGFGMLITIVAIAQVDPIVAAWLTAGLVLIVGGYAWWRYYNRPLTQQSQQQPPQQNQQPQA